MISIEQQLSEMTFEGVLEDEIVIARALKIAESAYQPGRPLRAVMSLVATLVSRGYNRYALPALRGRYFQTAQGAWLTLLAWTDRDTERAGGEFASGDTEVENRGGGFFNFQAGDLRIRNANGKTFTNTSPGHCLPWLGSGPFPRLKLSWSADEAGTGSNTAAGEIQPFPAALVSGPANLYAVTNASAWLGADEEDDASLGRRAVLAPSRAAPNGPRAKYEAIARETLRPDGKTRVNINRVRILEPGGAVVRVICASPAGAASGALTVAGSDLFQVNAQIQSLVTPPGATASVEAATERLVALGTITVYVSAESNTTRPQAEAAAQAALVEWAKALPIGGRHTVAGAAGYVFVEEATRIAASAVPGAFRATCAAADVALAANEVAVIFWSVLGVVVKQG